MTLGNGNVWWCERNWRNRLETSGNCLAACWNNKSEVGINSSEFKWKIYYIRIADAYHNIGNFIVKYKTVWHSLDSMWLDSTIWHRNQHFAKLQLKNSDACSSHKFAFDSLMCTCVCFLLVFVSFCVYTFRTSRSSEPRENETKNIHSQTNK